MKVLTESSKTFDNARVKKLTDELKQYQYAIFNSYVDEDDAAVTALHKEVKQLHDALRKEKYI